MYLQVGRPENSVFLWPAYVTRLPTARSRKSGYGLLVGCRPRLDARPFDFFFFDDIDPKKPRENLHCLFWPGIAIDRAWSN